MVLNSADAVKKAFVKTDDFSHRNPDMKKSFDFNESELCDKLIQGVMQ